MGGPPGKYNEGQPQSDQNPSQDKVKSDDEAKSAWNRRARESGRSADKMGRTFTGPDRRHELYNMASAPPKIGEGQDKSIPQGDIKIPKREPPASKLNLRDHIPSAPPEKQDKSDINFPPEVITHSDAGLSNAEKAERARIAHPSEGIGFAFGKDKPQKAEKNRWNKELSAEKKAALKDPDTIIIITVTCSKPGNRESNQDLSNRRAENTAEFLIKDHGVDPSRIVLRSLGESSDHDNKFDNRDDHQKRVALINFRSKSTEKKATLKRVANEVVGAGRKVSDSSKLPEPQDKYKVKDGIKDGIKDFAVNLISESAGAAKMCIDYLYQWGGAVSEVHEKNKQETIARGVQYSLNIISRDVVISNTPHVTNGKPYTTDELAKRIRKNGLLSQREMTFLKMMNTKEFDKQFRKGIGIVVSAINPILAKARTPEHRRLGLDAFGKEAYKRDQANKKRAKNKDNIK